MNKKGICGQIGSAYSYLLLQCGVDAITYSGLDHGWSYVKINGKEYHIDPTWVLVDHENIDLTYFMMTTQERIEGVGDTLFPAMYSYDYFVDNVQFNADDETYKPLHGGIFKSIDREKKIVYYDVEGETKEFHYDA